MSAYLKRLNIGAVEEVGVETTGTAYLKRVEIVEVVDQDGNPWEPVPGPDPWDELVVVDKADWSGSNVFAVGEDVTGTSATYTGGTDQVIYRSRVQYKSATDSTWVNPAWQTHTNAQQVIHFTIPEGIENGQVRFQTQARDQGEDPALQINSFASIKNLDDIDWDPIAVTVNDVEYDVDTAPALTVLINDPMPVVVTHNTNIDDATYQWSSREGSPMFGTPTDKNTVITLPTAGYYITTLTMSSPKSDEIKSIIVQFYAVDALD
jgi:hypothetical protein